MDQNVTDARHMARALDLASRGSYHVHPNPRVGAVLALGEVVVAEGYHANFGGPHAEVEAFAAYAALADRPPMAELTLYVNLEPCAHEGKTPPCVDAVVRSGLRRVVIGQRDPNPLVDGRGIELLRRAGIAVDVGVLETKARRMNAAFNKFMITQRPLVIAKWAMSLDGKIAARTGDSKWISGVPARVRTHELRGQSNGLIIGIGTAMKDDPRLTRREAPGRDPVRVIIDSKARIPLNLGIVQTARDVPTLLVTTDLAPEDKVAELRRRGMNLIRVPREAQHVDLSATLDELGRRGWHSILVEGGGQLLASFFRHDLVDQVMCFVAPKIIGGERAPTAAEGTGVSAIADALSVGPLEAEQVGDDVLLKGVVHDW